MTGNAHKGSNLFYRSTLQVSSQHINVFQPSEVETLLKEAVDQTSLLALYAGQWWSADFNQSHAAINMLQMWPYCSCTEDWLKTLLPFYPSSSLLAPPLQIQGRHLSSEALTLTNRDFLWSTHSWADVELVKKIRDDVWIQCFHFCIFYKKYNFYLEGS